MLPAWARCGGGIRRSARSRFWGNVSACPIPSASWSPGAATWARATRARTTKCRNSRSWASSAAARRRGARSAVSSAACRSSPNTMRRSRHASRRRQHQYLSGNPRRVRPRGARGRVPRLLREAAGRDGGRGAVDRRRGARRSPQARHRLHPTGPPRVAEVHRDRPHARQAARDAHEPEPAEPRGDVGHAPQSHEVNEPDRRLRSALRRRDVPDDGRRAGARLGDRCPADRRAEARHVQLRPPAGHVRRRVGRLVRGGVGSDDERGGVLREGRDRPEGLRLDRQGPERGGRRQARPISTATPRRTVSGCTARRSTPPTSSSSPTSTSAPKTSRITRGCAIASRRSSCARSATTST